MAKVLRWCVYTIPFISLVIFSDYISPFHFGKVIIFRSMIEIMAVLYLMLVFQDRAYLPRTNRIFWTLLAFAGAFSISTIFSVLPYASFWGSLERMGGLWTFWHYFVFFVITTCVIRTREQWYRLLDISIFVSILSSFYGFGQRTDIAFFVGSGGRERIFGTIGNPALFAGYEIINFFLALMLVVRPETTPGRKGLYGTAIVLNGIAILMTVVRGSVIGLGVGVFIFAAMYYLKFRSKIAKGVVMAGVAAVIVAVVIVFTPIHNTQFIASSRYLSRLTDTSFDSYTAKTRFWAWEAGLTGWKETPKTILVGWGPENFNIPFSKHFNPLFFAGPGSETLFDRAHNMFVEILVTMGLLGFIMYLSMFWGAFSGLSRVARMRSDDYVMKAGMVSLIVAYMIHNAFIFDTSANFIAFFTVLGFISFLLNSLESRPPATVRRIMPQALVNLVGGVLMVAAVVLVYRTNIVSAYANYATTRGIVKGWSNDFSGAMASYKDSINYDVAGKYEYRHRMAQAVLEYTNGKKLSPEVVDALKYSIAEVQKNADENPPDYLPLLYISRMYIMLGKEDIDSPYNDEALKYSMKALDISPTFVRTYYEIAQAYLNKKDPKSAAEYFKRAAQLNPDVGISYWYWGITLIESGDLQGGLEKAQRAIEKGYSLGEAEYPRLINVYVKLGDLKKVVESYEALIAIASTNAQYRASLAVAYARIGQTQKGIEQARKAAELDPNFAAEAKRFVESFGQTW